MNRDGILYTEEFKNVTENSKYSKYKTRPRIPPGKWRHVNGDGILYTEEFENPDKRAEIQKQKKHNAIEKSEEARKIRNAKKKYCKSSRKSKELINRYEEKRTF